MNTDAPIAIAAPDRTVRDIARRSITHRWMRPDATPWEDGGTRAVELHIAHDKDRKEIHAALSLIDVHPGFVSTRIARGHYLTIHRVPVARYSVKALDKASEDALFTLNLGQRDERVAALLAGNAF